MDLAARELSLWDTAAFPFCKETLVCCTRSVLRLGEVINCLVIVGVVLLLFGGVVLFGIGPSVEWRSPVAAGFDSDIVDTTHDSEEALLAPM